MQRRLKLGIEIFGQAPRLAKFPIDRQVWMELENYRVHYGPYEDEMMFILNSKLDEDVSELPGIGWIEANAPEYFKHLIRADQKYSEELHTLHFNTWNDIREILTVERKNVETNAGTKKNQKVSESVSATPAKTEYLGVELVHGDIKGDGFVIRPNHNVLIWENRKIKQEKVQSKTIQKFDKNGLGVLIDRVKGQDNVIPGIVKKMQFPFSEAEWRSMRKSDAVNMKSAARKVLDIAPVFAKALEVEYYKKGLPNFAKAKDVWRLKYLAYLLSDIQWINLSSLSLGHGVKQRKKNQLNKTSTLEKLNNNAGKPTSKVNTKANVSRKSRNQRGEKRERLTYEERRQRNAKKRLDYYDDQTYMENHYVRYPSARQRHNDGGGWS